MIWFCKVLFLFQIESKTDLGWKRHSCAVVSVLEEYTGARRPGNSFRLLAVLTVLMHISVIQNTYNIQFTQHTQITQEFQDLYLVTLQRGWMTVTQKLSTSAACSRKFFMSSLSLQYWVGWHWCLSATLAPSHSPCARRHATFLAHPATRRRTLGCCKLLYSSIADERCSR